MSNKFKKFIPSTATVLEVVAPYLNKRIITPGQKEEDGWFLTIEDVKTRQFTLRSEKYPVTLNISFDIISKGSPHLMEYTFLAGLNTMIYGFTAGYNSAEAVRRNEIESYNKDHAQKETTDTEG